MNLHQTTESHYPITFRTQDAQNLGTHLRQHNSVVLIGMKRVGISSFLRFFLHHPKVVETYIDQGKHCFVHIDLNNLVEKTLYAFWMLTLKRIADHIQEGEFSDDLKRQSQQAFTQSIQLSDFFFTLQTVHTLSRLIVSEGKYLTLFFNRFDRIQEVATQEFFANIQGLKDEVSEVSFVFTSYRPLHEIVPHVFTRSSLSIFAQDMYFKPANSEDMHAILDTFQKRYDLQLSSEIATELLSLSGGHVQYLQLSLIKCRNEGVPESAAALRELLTLDEQIGFLSEELFASLSQEEQEMLIQIHQKKKKAIGTVELNSVKYLIDTGILQVNHKGSIAIFNPLFQSYLDQISPTKNAENEFTKKEHLLFSLLEQHEGELVEREKIISAVWPEEEEFGVSDWSIDRLVARVRAKLKAQNSEYKIVTVITRGYKLTK